MKRHDLLVWVVLVGAIIGLLPGLVRIYENPARPAPDRFFTVARRGENPATNLAQAVFARAEVPMAVVCGAGFVQQPLRVKVYRDAGSVRRLVMESDAVIIHSPGNFHAWSLTDLPPGNYLVELEVSGRAERTQQIKVTP